MQETRKPEIEIVRPAVLGIEDAARYIGCRKTFMTKLIAEGAIPSFKMGQLRRIRIADLDKFIEDRLREEQRS